MEKRIQVILQRFPHLGCSRDRFREWIEAQWEPGMSWENYGRSGWHIDHIKPKAQVNYADASEYRALCYFRNLRPLWARENCADKSRERVQWSYLAIHSSNENHRELG